MSTRLHPAEARDAPGHYEIRLQGHLDERWAARFAGLGFSHEQDGTTTLSGPVIDQAALFGLLRTVRDLGLPLVAVKRIEGQAADTPEIGVQREGHRSKKELEP